MQMLPCVVLTQARRTSSTATCAWSWAWCGNSFSSIKSHARCHQRSLCSPGSTPSCPTCTSPTSAPTGTTASRSSELLRHVRALHWVVTSCGASPPASHHRALALCTCICVALRHNALYGLCYCVSRRGNLMQCVIYVGRFREFDVWGNQKQ